MHLLFNIIGTIIFSVIAIVYFEVLHPEAGVGIITQTEISIVHTAFNIGTTVLLFPVSSWIIKLAKKIGRVEEIPRTRARCYWTTVSWRHQASLFSLQSEKWLVWARS